MATRKMNYFAFADESYITSERFRGVSVFSMPQDAVEAMRFDVVKILRESNVKEFKWQKVASAKYRLCGEKILHCLIDNLAPRSLRVDTLIWDTHDSRHSIKGRDDIANFERMFFHLLKHCMKRREIGADWHVFPDERKGIDWSTIAECLLNVGQWQYFVEHTLLDPEWRGPLYNLLNLIECDSAQEPLCQIADFFAGLGVFSRKHYGGYSAWCKREGPQQLLIPCEETGPASNSQNERFELLSLLNSECKKRKLGVSLSGRKKGLWTPRPSYPINFWPYEPQNDEDRAPIRNG